MGAFAAFDQRIALRYHLDGMDLAETDGYLSTTCSWPDEATRCLPIPRWLIHQNSRGIPRAVNNLAVQSLVVAFAESKGMVDEVCARAAVAEVTSD